MVVLGPQTVPDTTAPHLCLWNTARYFDLNPAAADRHVRLDHTDADGRLVGSVVGGLDGADFTSGFGAPFAGPDFARDYEPPSGVVALVRSTLEQLADRAVTTVRVRMKPPHWSDTEAHLTFTLLTAGFAVEEVNVNFFLDVRDIDTVDGWTAARKPQIRRVLERARGLGLTVENADADDEDTWHTAYRVLEANRVDKGRPMRLPFDYVWGIRAAFPGLVRMLVARATDGAVVAAALLYRVAAGHDVVQYWGDAFHDLPVTPMVLLVEGVVAEALATGARFVDLGISTEHGWPNHGLIQFKRNIGARAEPRLELVGDLATVLAHPGWERLGA